MSSSWCRNSNSRSSSMSGLAGSGSSSTPGNNSSCNTSTTTTSSSSNSSTCNSSSSSSSSGGLSSSSYCRRLGSASNSSRRSATFQLWSPRLRLRDERKRVLKLSLAKLRRIDDAESCLRRSVLLNNTLRRLQRDARDEKSGGGQTNNHVISSAGENDCSSRLHQQHPAVRLSSSSSEEDNNNHQAELQTMRSLLSCDELPLLNSGLTGGDLSMVENGGSQSRAQAGSIKRRRTSSDVTDDLAASLAAAGTSSSSSLDSSCGGLNFGDLYLPPTPRMISSLEDEEEAAEAWQCVKRPKISSNSTAGSDVSGRNRPALRPCNSLPSLTTTTSSSSTTATSSSSSSSYNQNNSPILTGYTSCLTSGLSLINGSNSSSSAAAAAAAAAAQQSTYSCGQSSLFGELQSVVFHSLITSLES